jgi:hypothetical protein
MPAVRLPQSVQEIYAASQLIVDSAYPDLKVSPSRKMAQCYDSDRRHVARWLASIAPLGAVMHVDLVTAAELCLNTSSEHLQSLRPSRVALLLARRSWVGTKA